MVANLNNARGSPRRRPLHDLKLAGRLRGGAMLLALVWSYGTARAGDPPFAPFNYVIGTQTIGASYQFTKEPRLVETARAILAMGSSTLKFSLTPQGEGAPKPRTLAEVAERDPAVKAVFELPFADYVMWVSPLAATGGGAFAAARLEAERQEIQELAKYLLKTYNGTGKSFYLGNWEGDWLLTHTNPDYVPTSEEVENMVRWANTRQKAVDDAGLETPHANVHVYYYVEVNRVFDAMEGKTRVANQVLPRVNPDFVSYSSYDAQSGDLENNFARALDYIQAQLAPKPGLPGKRVFIGEYGMPLLGNSAQAQDRLARRVMRAGLSWGCPFILYWEMYNNEVTPEGQQRGFWLIDDHNVKQPVYFTHEKFYERARAYVADFTKQHERVPNREEYGRAALAWLPAETGTSIARVQLMARVPEPLVVRDWREVARQYYGLLLDPATRIEGKPLVVLETNQPSFDIPSWVGKNPQDEAFTCLIPVIGAKLVGLDPRHLHGFDYVQAAKSWFDEKNGVYRHTRGDRGQAVYHADIYGYWAGIQGLMLASQYPGDADFQRQQLATVKAFLRLAQSLGCPTNGDFDVLGFNFDKGAAEGRPEPMNRLGHAPSVAWPLLVGCRLTGDSAMRDCARAAMQWHIDHPGRYEISHVMGPLTAARLNAEYNGGLDLDRVLATWFGDGESQRLPWKVTAGARFGGLTCDGLDGADWGGPDHGFHAFAMGTFQGPAWLVPVARYDARYARDIGRYALHAAASARLFQGVGLDWDHQDHLDWKDRWDPQNLFSYEAVVAWDWSPERKFRPYATGDPVRLGWGLPKIAAADYGAEKRKWFSQTSHNLALYMGNHIGFLGGIMTLTDVPGLLRWDCLATDWFHAPAYPTYLFYNPHPSPRTFQTDFGPEATDLYDAVTHRLVERQVRGKTSLTLAAETAAVIVLAPAGGKVTIVGNRSLIDGVPVDYRNE